MSWIRESKLSFFQSCAVYVIRCGRVPRHVAFIMDGNRRYAKRNKVEKIEGHSKGFDKLADTLYWLHELGIKEATVYAFSIENFKRTKEEVDNLLDLAREKFKRLLAEKDKIMEKGVCIRIIGNLDLLPDDIQKLMSEIMLFSKDNTQAVLNLAFAYTSREEITQAVQKIVKGAADGSLMPEDVSQKLLSECLYTYDSSPPDLLIRTSGEVRLSDYLLWQVSTSTLYFTDVLWPDFTIWHLLSAVFHYQRNYDTLKQVQEVEASTASGIMDPDRWEHVVKFLRNMRSSKLDELNKMATAEVSC